MCYNEAIHHSFQDSFNITDGIDGSAVNYTITYSEPTFDSICGSDTIPVLSCDRGICSHVFDIPISSSCPSSTAITVKVIASNKLGNGTAVNSITTGK